MVGKSLSHYKILEELGRGGMGVVYKATDTELNRTVALKFLPPNVVATDKDRQRFRREAQAAAGLSHPNIATVFAIEEEDDQAFIAMEFVDGETLNDLIEKAPLKIDRAIEIAIQVAEGLLVAHDNQIIHRDIKPSNIMITSRGHVKIMDFGLAKVSAASMLTQSGSTLGTVGYMSPEQAKGEDIDRRTDIWGLGCVLYQMICGQTPFAGEYEQAIVYSILNSDPPPLTSLRSGVPIALDGIIAKILAKDAALRYQHVDELPADLRAVQAGTSTQMSRAMPAYSGQMALAPPPPIQSGTVEVSAYEVSSGGFAKWLPWGLAGISVFAALFFALTGNPTPELEQIRRFILPIETEEGSLNDVPAISRDGTVVIYEAANGETTSLYARALSSASSIPLTTISGRQISESIVSNDGRWAAYRNNRSLLRISTSGGNSEVLSDTLGTAISTWLSDSELLLSQSYAERSYFYSLAEGDVRTLGSLENPAGAENVVHPAFIPEHEIIIYTVRTQSSDDEVITSLRALNIQTQEDIQIVPRAAKGRYVDNGYITFFRNGDIYAVPFDPASMTVGLSFPVQTEVGSFFDGGIVLYDASSNGTMIYVAKTEEDEAQERVVIGADPNSLIPFSASIDLVRDPRFSPDGTKILVQAQNGDNDVWMLDRILGTPNRMTFTPGEDETAAWAPDNLHFYYKSADGDMQYLIRSNIDNPAARDTLDATEEHIHVESVSRDGSLVVYSRNSEDNGTDLWYVNTESGEKLTLWASPFSEQSGYLSPDNEWIVYMSDVTGTREIHLNKFPEMNRLTILTSGGGAGPIWSESGESIFYFAREQIMRRAVENGVPGDEEVEMTLPPRLTTTGGHRDYDVLGEGEEFVFTDPGNRSANENSPINVITGLRTLLEQLDPEKN